MKTINVVEATQMPKIHLVILVFGENDANKYINLTIPEEHWAENGGNYHPASHVFDIRKKKPINVVEVGVKKGLIRKTA